MEGRRGPMCSGSLNKFEGSEGTAQVPEESGWTQYLEDFSSDHQIEKSSYSNESNGSPSLVSDAASPSHGALDMSKFNKEDIIACSTISGQHLPRKLNVKKQRTKKYSIDDLEDTASSPVNSPKVSSSKHTDVNNRTMDDRTGNFLGGKSGPVPLSQPDERSSIIIDGKNNEDYRDLKKRGLCLMPFSMLVNYLG